MMIYVGAFTWFASWAQVTLWAIFAQRISHKTRLIYFEKSLALDAAFYDANNPNEM